MTGVGRVTALPVVDLRVGAGRLRERLREAAHEVGFFYLTGHDVPETLTSRLLRAARRLFELPQADKDAVAMVRSPHFRGYTRLGGELTLGEVDWREQVDIGPERPPIGGAGKPDYLWLQGPNQWPAGLPDLPGIVDEWDAAMSAVARTVLGHLAAALGSPPDAFDSAFAETPATLIKIIRYPARAATSQGVGAHRDSGVLTLLSPASGRCPLASRTAAACRCGEGMTAGSTCRRGRGRSSSTSASYSRSPRAAICGLPSTGLTCNGKRPIGSRSPIFSILGWTRRYRCCRCPTSWLRTPPSGRIPPIRSSRSTVATRGRVDCARTRMWLRRTDIRQVGSVREFRSRRKGRMRSGELEQQSDTDITA
jgi:non-haem dioxygenase in morphine synthesis N-terminal